MKYLMAGLLALLCGFFLADFLFRQQASEVKTPGNIPFDHALHGDSIGLDCSHCHTGVTYQAHAYLPSKTDCMDCHRLPLTENPGIEKLDSALSRAEEFPWVHKRVLPEHVVFHHALPCRAAWTAIAERPSKAGVSRRLPSIAGRAIVRVLFYG